MSYTMTNSQPLTTENSIKCAVSDQSFNQRLSSDERLKIFQLLGWKTLRKEHANSDGWASIEDPNGHVLSVNIETGTVTDHSGDYSIDIVDFVAIYAEGAHNQAGAIEWIRAALGKPDNSINLKPGQQKFKHAVGKHLVKYGMLPKCLMNDPDIKATAKVVYVAIQERCGRRKDCSWAGIDTIAKDTGLGKRTVQRAIEELTQSEYLIEKRGPRNIRYRYPLVKVSETEAGPF